MACSREITPGRTVRGCGTRRPVLSFVTMIVRVRLLLSAVALVAIYAGPACGQPKISPLLVHTGMCGASAAVALDAGRFVVADDEDSVLRVYARDQAGPPLQQIDLSAFLELDSESAEPDLEGAARIGDRIYWLGSHARNQEGKKAHSRRRFFATKVTVTGAAVQLTPVGSAYQDLLRDLVAEPKLKSFKLAAAAKKAPKEKGALNIEGLCATPQGHLLIGFRNPVPSDKALLVPLLNPDQVVTGQAARFGDPILLDLDGRGVRDMACCGGKYFIIAGHRDGRGHSTLYQWAGGSARPEPIPDTRLKGLNPEVVVFYPDTGCEAFQLLSDDGSNRRQGTRCKDLANTSARRFRSVWVEP